MELEHIQLILELRSFEVLVMHKLATGLVAVDSTWATTYNLAGILVEHTSVIAWPYMALSQLEEYPMAKSTSFM